LPFFIVVVFTVLSTHCLWFLAGVFHQVSKELLVLGDKVGVEEVREGLVERQTQSGTVCSFAGERNNQCHSEQLPLNSDSTPLLLGMSKLIFSL